MSRTRFGWVTAGWLLTALAATAAPDTITSFVRPYETDRWPTKPNAVDQCVLAACNQAGIPFANPCSDEVFIRRVYFDMIGTLPDAEQVLTFLRESGYRKRIDLIESLFKRPEFADYWAMKWCDLLRVKAEFPVNLWPNAAQAYHRWVRDAMVENRPYDRFVRELLTSSGSNFRSPPVNFYRAIQGRDPTAIADAVALTFMGTRLDKWPDKARRTGIGQFFSRIQYKKTEEWKEEIVCLDPNANGPLTAIFPDGATAVLSEGTEPRQVFAVWLINAQNPWFAKCAVNRLWCWLMGRGIIHEPDDIRADNPPANPQLLALLESEFVRSGWDLRHVMRLILNSRTYQQSCLPRSNDPRAEALSAFYPVRRLDAELLHDALKSLTGGGDTFSSAIPEPFTYIPKDARAIELPDGSISSPFLEMFGRPSRDTGLNSERSNKPTDGQRLYLLNSSEVLRRLSNSPKLRYIINNGARKPEEMIWGLYFTILSRGPSPAELAAAEEYDKGKGATGRRAVVDLAWALINTKEFLYRH